jgi:signal peptidase
MTAQPASIASGPGPPTPETDAAHGSHSSRAKALRSLARSSAFQRGLRLSSYLALAGVLGTLVLVAAATVPNLFGYHTYVVNGGSMEPSLPIGSAAVTKPTGPRALSVGDIIARHDAPGEPPVLHRVVDIAIEDGEWLFVTQGDRNDGPDGTPVRLTGAGDKVVYSVPYAGYILNFAGTWYGRLLLIGGPVILLSVVYIREAQRKRHSPAAPPVVVTAASAAPRASGVEAAAPVAAAPEALATDAGPFGRANEAPERAPRLRLVTPEALAPGELPVFLRAQLDRVQTRPAAGPAEERRVA